jgi:hypothetical protein
MNGAILRLSVVWLGFLVWGCASFGPIRDFTFVPSTDETYSEVQQARLYKNGVDRPHRIIGEVTMLGRTNESQESLEKRLLEAVGKFGANGVVLVETNQKVSEVGLTGIRHDLSGGASKEYRPYPSPVSIEEERPFIRGMALRFIEE